MSPQAHPLTNPLETSLSLPLLPGQCEVVGSNSDVLILDQSPMKRSPA